MLFKLKKSLKTSTTSGGVSIISLVPSIEPHFCKWNNKKDWGVTTIGADQGLGWHESEFEWSLAFGTHRVPHQNYNRSIKIDSSAECYEWKSPDCREEKIDFPPIRSLIYFSFDTN